MKKPFLILWILIGVFFIFFWVYLPSLSKYRDLKSKQEDIERQIRGLEIKIKTLKEERDLLKGDVAYLEKVIRDELGLVKPGEIVYKFVPDKTKKSEAAVPKPDEKKKEGEGLPPEKPSLPKEASSIEKTTAAASQVSTQTLAGIQSKASSLNAQNSSVKLSEPFYPRQETR